MLMQLRLKGSEDYLHSSKNKEMLMFQLQFEWLTIGSATAETSMGKDKKTARKCEGVGLKECNISRLQDVSGWFRHIDTGIKHC